MKRRHEHRQPGFTLVELLIVVAIISILIAILAPAGARALELARRVHCSNNLKNIVLACHAYAGENHGRWPNAYTPKSKQTDTLPINRMLVEALDQLKNPATNGCVFVNRDGKPFKSIRTACRSELPLKPHAEMLSYPTSLRIP